MHAPQLASKSKTHAFRVACGSLAQAAEAVHHAAGTSSNALLRVAMHGLLAAFGWTCADAASAQGRLAEQTGANVCMGASAAQHCSYDPNSKLRIAKVVAEPCPPDPAWHTCM